MSANSGGLSYDEALELLREICNGFPEMSERLSHGSPSFFVREKRVVVSVHPAGHYYDAVSLWAPAPEGVQGQLVDAEPERFYVPPYVGPSGWIGLRLDIDADPDEIAAIVEDSYRKVAPKTLVKQLDESNAG